MDVQFEGSIYRVAEIGIQTEFTYGYATELWLAGKSNDKMTGAIVIGDHAVMLRPSAPRPDEQHIRGCDPIDAATGNRVDFSAVEGRKDSTI